MRKVTVRRNDLKKVVDYLLADEEKHYEETETGEVIFSKRFGS